ncbi:MAG: RNA polymerase factor sigma-54 [Pseudomonadota bacterium]|nr:RNA polymerase factor sigma-54 [Pseudomonadota bacterium]
MKPRLQTSLGQQLVLTPQLRQAIRLLQLSAAELEQELAAAIESNPLLDWVEPTDGGSDGGDTGTDMAAAPDPEPQLAEAWSEREEAWVPGSAAGGDDNAAERVAEPETLHDHLLWQLHLTHLSPRDRLIGVTLVDAIDDQGYLRETLESIAQALLPETSATIDEVQAVLRQVQRMDPPGVGARDLGECLSLQLALLDDTTPGKALALRIADGFMERLHKAGVAGAAAELHCTAADVEEAVALLRTLDPRPGGGIGAVAAEAYVTPDCTIWRHNGTWRVALTGQGTRLTIHRGYEAMIGAASATDASYLRGHLQEARWLLRNLQARGETLLRVVECLVHQQSGFLEFGDQALRPLTLREVATELELHESTISRAVSRKYVRTPRGTLPLRAFFASGIDTGGGGEASSTAIQSMIRRLIAAEDPRKPLSDARLAQSLKASGVPVARRTVAKYREALNIPSSHDRVRVV